MAMKVERSIGQARRGEDGFSLLEVLIANVMLAIGLLAIAAMQDVALSRNLNSKQLTVATSMATEMLERIRFNAPANSKPLAVGVYLYHGIQACSDVLAYCPGGETPGNATSTNNLTANGDYKQWAARLKATDAAGNLLLPAATGTVASAVILPTEQVQITVTIKWGLKSVTMNTVVAPF
jgi:type IV pilus modification protein PilV